MELKAGDLFMFNKEIRSMYGQHFVASGDMCVVLHINNSHLKFKALTGLNKGEEYKVRNVTKRIIKITDENSIAAAKVLFT